MSSKHSSSGLIDIASDRLYADQIPPSSRLIPPEHVYSVKSKSRLEPPVTRRRETENSYSVNDVTFSIFNKIVTSQPITLVVRSNI